MFNYVNPSYRTTIVDMVLFNAIVRSDDAVDEGKHST